MPNSQRQSQERRSEYNRHKSYLKKLKHTSLFCPRYDMLSLNNNLLLHRNYDPKKDLIPKTSSHQLRELQGEIRKKMMARAQMSRLQQGRLAGKWYQAVLKEEQYKTEGRKFQFEYEKAPEGGTTVRESLNRLYNRGKVYSHSRKSYVSDSIGRFQ